MEMKGVFGPLGESFDEPSWEDQDRQRVLSYLAALSRSQEEPLVCQMIILLQNSSVHQLRVKTDTVAATK